MNEITITLTGQEAQKWLQEKLQKMQQEKERKDAQIKHCHFCAKFNKSTCMHYSADPTQEACEDFVVRN